VPRVQPEKEVTVGSEPPLMGLVGN